MGPAGACAFSGCAAAVMPGGTRLATLHTQPGATTAAKLGLLSADLAHHQRLSHHCFCGAEFFVFVGAGPGHGRFRTARPRRARQLPNASQRQSDVSGRIELHFETAGLDGFTRGQALVPAEVRDVRPAGRGIDSSRRLSWLSAGYGPSRCRWRRLAHAAWAAAGDGLRLAGW